VKVGQRDFKYGYLLIKSSHGLMKRAAPDTFFHHRPREEIVPFSYKEWRWGRFGFLFMLLPWVYEWPEELALLVITDILRAAFEREVEFFCPDSASLPFKGRLFLANGLLEIETLILKIETDDYEVDRIDVHGLCCYVRAMQSTECLLPPHTFRSDQDFLNLLELTSSTREVLRVCYSRSYTYYDIGYEEVDGDDDDDDELDYEEYTEDEDEN
jgi:hypothetical protein